MDPNDVNDVLAPLEREINEAIANPNIDRGYKDELTRRQRELLRMIKNFSDEMRRKKDSFIRDLQSRSRNVADRVKYVKDKGSNSGGSSGSGWW